jgi:hypothetical protein
MAGALAGALLLLSACTNNPPPQNLPPTGGMVMTTTIQIINSGATDSIGYRVMIGTGGEASFVSGDGSGNATLPADMFAQLNHAIADAKPLAGLPTPATCMKPVSFGTSTFVAVGGDRSPDLTCPANDAARNLKQDVDATITYLKIRNVPRGAGKELPPQNL